MSSSGTLGQLIPGKYAQLATRLVFFIVGFCVSAWAPLVPLVKARAGLDEGALGLLLLCLGVGSISAMPVAGYLVGRHGCRKVILFGGLLICCVLPFLAYLSSTMGLVLAIMAFGVGLGVIDCSMNIQAVLVNNASPRPIMSSFHGLYSLGGISGAISMTALLGIGMPALWAIFCVVAVTLIMLGKAAPHLLPYGGHSEGPFFAIPRGKVLFLGILCFIIFLTEGAMLDWSGVFLVSLRGMDTAYGGMGYAVFAATMTIARLMGDATVVRFGAPRVLVIGSLCAASGILVSLASTHWIVALIGYGLVGAGCANIVPILFTSVTQQTSMPSGSAVPAMTTLGYAGVLMGPAFIGFVAHAISLPKALGLVAIALLFVAASGRFLKA